ncbi:hypothetical protein HY496_00675 [Candidatus Woesearchaeota archaeon]|nr:hypothetical protein [Candidatus Woesearchaeota archaeon]
MSAEEESKSNRSSVKESEAKEGEAAATQKEASAIRRAVGAFQQWATTYNRERQRTQAEALRSGVQAVGRGARSAAGAVSGTVGAGAAVGGAMLAGAKSSAVLLVFLGAIHYAFRLMGYNPAVILAFSIALFLISGYAVAAHLQRERLAVLLPMITFLVWYWALDATLEPSRLIWFSILTVTVFVVIGLLTKWEALSAEAAGFLPVLVLFLDVSLLPFMIQKLELTIGPVLEVLLYVPWWFLSGLMLLPAQPTESRAMNSLLGFLKVISFVVLVLALVLPGIPTVGYETAKSNIPTFEEFQKAQEDVLGKLPEGEHPFIANMMCLLGGDFVNLNDCVLQRQRRSQLVVVCRDKEEVKQDVVDIDDCVAEEQKKLAENVQVAGTVDREIRPTTAKFEIPPAPLQYTARPSYSATFVVENPRELELKAVLTCKFKKSVEEIPGEVSLQGITGSEAPVTITTDVAQIPLTCTPAQDLVGKKQTSYTMVVQATIKDMVTSSSLERAFIGQVKVEEKQKIVSELTRDRFPSAQKVYSSAPAEFAKINFGLGSPEQNPIISSTDVPRFVASVDNVGGGKILSIKSFSYSLGERGFSVRSGQQDCISGKEIILPEDAPRSFGLATCFLTPPNDLLNFQGRPKIETFFAQLVYDYQITRESTVQVQVIELG